MYGVKSEITYCFSINADGETGEISFNGVLVIF
jgi:hypothetical protein